MKRDFDIAIAGGGMVGAALAALLTSRPETSRLRIALLEPRPAAPPAAGDPLDLRVSALSRASQRLFERTGAWPAVVARGASPYRRMVVWDAADSPDGPGAIRFDAAELAEPDLGHIVENRSAQAALLKCARERGVKLLQSGVASVVTGGDAALVTTPEDRRLSCALVIGADGHDSAVRRLAGIGTRGWAYAQNGIVAHLATERPHQETAWQRFLPGGPLALLPLADGRVSLVWTVPAADAQALAALDDEAFGLRVTEASGGVLGALKPTTPRTAFPLRLMHALEYTRPRLALIGDAAHAVHPLAGQGVNLGFMDAAALAQVLGEALAAGRDIGEHAVLRRYERWRKAENMPAMALMDGLQKLFGSDLPLLAWARRTGLGLVDRAEPVKRSLIRRAMGVAGDVPAALR
ncbi:MAG: UbiH/UbiF/VisC/COQ6 family ubiquinone biosynthesis hydroxylase [Steroidobacteraceae bacterium]|jgi:2-octaprenylphenol hydroxylase|nr:UbiH/UbiF/VisC/COQ6 family ubiquinone biosynthesis hydroxylase [Steroidobacteraceae bacterium]